VGRPIEHHYIRRVRVDLLKRKEAIAGFLDREAGERR